MFYTCASSHGIPNFVLYDVEPAPRMVSESRRSKYNITYFLKSRRDHSFLMSIRAPRKGENYELSVDLNSEYRDKRKDAIKRVIASMTVGKGMEIC